MDEIDKDDAKVGVVYLAWLGQAALPSYKLVSMVKSRKWYIEGGNSWLSQGMVTDLWELPAPGHKRKTNG